MTTTKQEWRKQPIETRRPTLNVPVFFFPLLPFFSTSGLLFHDPINTGRLVWCYPVSSPSSSFSAGRLFTTSQCIDLERTRNEEMAYCYLAFFFSPFLFFSRLGSFVSLGEITPLPFSLSCLPFVPLFGDVVPSTTVE